MNPRTTLVVFLLACFFQAAQAAPIVKIVSVETLDAQDTFFSALSMVELKKIRVQVTNIGDTACTSSVGIGLSIKDATNMEVIAVAPVGIGSLNPNETGEHDFTTDTGGPLESFTTSPSGTYRAIATVECADTPTVTETKTLVFSIVEKSNLQIPETHPFAIFLLAIGVLAFLFQKHG